MGWSCAKRMRLVGKWEEKCGQVAPCRRLRVTGTDEEST